MITCDSHPLVLLTGATGYIGGRLLSKLEQRNSRIRCIVRQPKRLAGQVAQETEIIAGDVMDFNLLHSAMQGVDTAFYLIHSMGSSERFEDADREAAKTFAHAATRAGVRRIIYLGGLGDDEHSLSPHLRSRHEVGDLLRESSCQVIELRASIVIGSGSLSFELVRSLVERLPVMICPKWVSTLAQPIAVEDVLEYLLAALDWNKGGNLTFEVGGPDRVTYGEIMREYARQRGLRRLLISVPVLTPWLSSIWLALVTPIYARIGRKLVESMRNPTVVNKPAALGAFPLRPRGLVEAIERAVINEDREIAETRWSDACSSTPSSDSSDRVQFGRRLVDVRTIDVSVSPSCAFQPIQQIGGRRGWYHANGLWQLRAWIDVLAGGIGSRRGRRDSFELRVGDTLDWWRVEAYEPGRLLRLKAEMKLPGRAWLEFEVARNGTGSTIRQTASFDPCGLFGILYWYVLVPLHSPIFRGMLQQIARLAEERNGELGNTAQHQTVGHEMRSRSGKQGTQVKI